MYGQGYNFAPPFGQGDQTPRPPFQQRPVTPDFQQGPPSIAFQYQRPPPLPGQHGPQSFHLPPRLPQVNFNIPALHSYPNAQQNTQWPQNAQRALLPLSPPLAPPPPPPPAGQYRPNMFQPPVSYIGSTYTPQLTSQIRPSPPPPPLAPPPLPPSSPPPVPPSPPPALSPKSSQALTPTALDAASELPQNLKSGSDAADKSVATIENIDDRNIGDDDDKHLRGRTDEVDSPDFENLSSEETEEFDPFSPPPKPERENLVRRIEVICRFIAKNGPGFEQMTRLKESVNPEFRFLFGGEPGSEDAVAHEYFKWVKRKCLLQKRESHSTVEIPKAGTSVQTKTMNADVSPSVSDMEMEDDFTEPDNIHCETSLIPVNHDTVEQPQKSIESNISGDTVSTFSQMAEEEKGTGSELSLHDDQPSLGNAFPIVDSLNTTPTEAAELTECGFTGVSYSPSLEDTYPIVKSPDELIKSASPIKLIPNYSSDDSSEHEKRPSLEDIAPMTMPLLNTTNDPSLYVDTQPKDVVNEVAPEDKKPPYQIENVKHTPAVLRKVDELGRFVRNGSSDSDRDESYRTRKHGKRGRTRSRSPHERRSRRSPRRRREKRSWSRSWSPKRRRSRSRSRSPSHRRGIESGRERERKDKGRRPDCMDFLRGKCYRGESCRYMHRETGKSAKNIRSMRTSNIREVEKREEMSFPARNSVQTTVSDQVDKTLVPDLYKSEKSTETAEMVWENSDIKEETFEDRREKEESDHAGNRSSSRLLNDGVLVNSLVETSFGLNSTTKELVIEKSLDENSEPDLNKDALSIPNQGAYFEPPAPSLPHLSKEMVQPPTNHPYQGHLQTQQPHYPTLTNNWPPPPPPPIQQNQFPSENNYMMFPHHSYPTPSTQIEDIGLKPLSNFPLPSIGLPTNQLYPINNFTSNDPSVTNSQNYAYQVQQPQYSYGNINAPFGGSKISHHYNPYASAFDQPINSKFSSNVLNPAKDLAIISPLKTAELPKSASDQYDPLFDSIEPSSNSFKKLDQGLGLESTLRLSSSRKEYDVGENSREKEVDMAPRSTSMKSNEEFGETVEEVEIDQVKSPEKEQKNKDSKSMKLFKSSLAEYVKEVLKPHWRQGGMSKEAFKIIVKKTIDKVSGAMKSHHIPKSQEKINRYIDSSERKLNKLVMGYVDKYAKT